MKSVSKHVNLESQAFQTESMTRKEIELRKRLVRMVKSGISGGLDRLVTAAECLRDLRDARLYRNTHGTFEEFCRDEFALTRQMINKRIAAADAFRGLSDAAFGKADFPKLPENEAQVAELSSAPEAKRAEVWIRAVEKAGGVQPSTRLIRQVVGEVVGRKSTPPEKRDRLLVLRATNFLRHVSKPTKNISAAIDLLSRTFEGSAEKVSNRSRKPTNEKHT